ncbi:PP2C family protein-serine/threonine phosphatase [Magnetococcales bacterium HHB-1]
MERKKTILVVDDERLNINILVELLESDYTLLVAKNGQQALKRVQGKLMPDLILLDIMMPGMNGHEVLTHLKADKKTADIPVIFVTAMGQSEDETQGLELGAVDYIRKPFNPAVVKARIRTHLALRDAYCRLEDKNRLLLYERSLIENIILRMREVSTSKNPNIRTLITPVEKTAGDIVLWLERPDGVYHILLGDFTGHGLPAAIGAPLVTELFQSMTLQGDSLQTIMMVINNRLHKRMPVGLFMAACLVEWHVEQAQMHLWNSAMPAPVLFRADQSYKTFSSCYLPLGVVPDVAFNQYDQIDLQPEDRLVIHSDGVIETTRDCDQALFGEERMIDTLRNDSLDHLALVLKSFRGETEQSDDVTVIELQCP